MGGRKLSLSYEHHICFAKAKYYILWHYISLFHVIILTKTGSVVRYGFVVTPTHNSTGKHLIIIPRPYARENRKSLSRGCEHRDWYSCLHMPPFVVTIMPYRTGHNHLSIYFEYLTVKCLVNSFSIPTVMLTYVYVVIHLHHLLLHESSIF